MNKKLIYKIANSNLLLPIVLLVISLFMRFQYSVNHINFSQDNARDLLVIEESYKNNNLIFYYGPKTSAGNFYSPPFYYQLHILISYLSGFNPMAMKYFTTFIESLTPLFIYLILRNFFNKKISFISSLIFIFSNLVIIFGTSAWNPNMIPFLTTLALYFWLNYINKNNKKAIIGGTLSTILAFQLHYQVTVLFLFILILFLWSLIKRKKDFKYWLIALIVCILSFSPYIYKEIISNWQNTKSIYEFFTNEHSKYYDRISKIYYVKDFYPVFIEKLLFKNTLDKEIIGRTIFYFGMLIFSLYSLKNKKKNIIWLFIYFISIFFMLRVYKGDKQEYYLSTLFILPSILVAFLLSVKKYFISKIIIIFIVFIAFQSGINLSKEKKDNQYKNLNNIFTTLNQELKNTSKIRVQFHNIEHINTFAYGFKHFSNIDLDMNSKIIVDICDKNEICSWDKINWCRYKLIDNQKQLDGTRANIYSSILKSNAKNYSLISEIYNPYYRISISKVSNLEEPKYQISKVKYDYGNDFQLKDIIY